MKKLITITALAFTCGRMHVAEAAKLCRMNPAYGANSVATNLGDFSWFVGVDCCPSGTLEGDTCATTATYSGSGVPANGPCPTTMMAGKFTTNDSRSWGYVWNYEFKPTPIPENVADKEFVYCKVTYPFVSQWIPAPYNDCGHHMAFYSMKYIAMETR